MMPLPVVDVETAMALPGLVLVVSAGDCPVVVPVDAEVDEASEVHRGAAVSEADLVTGDASVADFAAPRRTSQAMDRSTIGRCRR